MNDFIRSSHMSCSVSNGSRDTRIPVWTWGSGREDAVGDAARRDEAAARMAAMMAHPSMEGRRP